MSRLLQERLEPRPGARHAAPGRTEFSRDPQSASQAHGLSH